jgi:DNA-binding transcriptional LysR family regulator
VHVGPLPDSTAKAKRLADLRRVFFASPGYFAKYGRPKRPEDLSKHQCIVRTARVGADIWPFTVDGKVKTIKVTGRFRANGASVINEAATHGLGIAIAPLWHIRPLIDRGLVELALARFSPPPIPVHVTWSGTRVLAAKTRMFIDFPGQRLKAERL